MLIKRIFAVPVHSIPADLAHLLIRLVMGTAFVLHGWEKIQHPFDWNPGFAPPPILALAALAEFGGGIALILGLLTRLACVGILCVMGTAFYMHTFMHGDPFVPVPPKLVPTSEPAAIYFCVALLLLVLGPGRLSLDRYFFGRKTVIAFANRDITAVEGAAIR
jgi:putative oxidoreductase